MNFSFCYGAKNPYVRRDFWPTVVAILCLAGPAILLFSVVGCVDNRASEIRCNGYFYDPYGRTAVIEGHGAQGVRYYWEDEDTQKSVTAIRYVTIHKIHQATHAQFRELCPDYPEGCK